MKTLKSSVRQFHGTSLSLSRIHCGKQFASLRRARLTGFQQAFFSLDCGRLGKSRLRFLFSRRALHLPLRLSLLSCTGQVKNQKRFEHTGLGVPNESLLVTSSLKRISARRRRTSFLLKVALVLSSGRGEWMPSYREARRQRQLWTPRISTKTTAPRLRKTRQSTT